MHDPDKGPQVRRAGVKARTESRPGMTPEQAAELIRLESPADIPGTLERVARMALTGQLDVRTVNAVVVAAMSAMRAHEPARIHREREEQRKARAAYAATPEGREQERALSAAFKGLDRQTTELLLSAYS
jgi:hypothetical protein